MFILYIFTMFEYFFSMFEIFFLQFSPAGERCVGGRGIAGRGGGLHGEVFLRERSGGPSGAGQLCLLPGKPFVFISCFIIFFFHQSIFDWWAFWNRPALPSLRCAGRIHFLFINIVFVNYNVCGNLRNL